MAAGKGTHSIMPKKLAEALMEAGVHHFDAGGVMNPAQAQTTDYSSMIKANPLIGSGSPLSPVGDVAGGMVNGFLSPTQSTFQANGPQITNQNFLPQIQTQQQRQTDVYNQQQNLANALMAQSQGAGPNPAQAQLATNTGANIAGQGALMAGQRGAGANAGLIARQAAMQGSTIQQQAVNQAATLQAQQQLAAQQQLQQQQASMAGGALQGESIQQGGVANQNSAAMKSQDINAQTSANNSNNSTKIFGGVLNGIGGAMGLAEGGEFEGKVPGTAEVSGNSEKNDTKPALLSPGEIVLPRSVTMAKNPEKKVIEFLRHLKTKKNDYGSVLDARKAKTYCGGGKV